MAGRGEKSRCRWSWGGQLRPGSALPALLTLEDGWHFRSTYTVPGVVLIVQTNAANLRQLLCRFCCLCVPDEVTEAQRFDDAPKVP